MDFPDEFKQLAFDTLIARLLDIESEDGVRDQILKSLKPERRRRLELYLAEILDVA